MLKKLELSKSGYYEYLKRKPSRQKIRKERIMNRIKQIHEESKEIYGAPKITRLLEEEGERISEKYVGNIMRENGMKAHYVRPYTITTKNSDFSSKLKNILKRDFNPLAPNEGFVYLNSIMDLYSRKVIAWTLSKTLIKREWLNRYKITDYTHAYRLVFEYLEDFIIQ